MMKKPKLKVALAVVVLCFGLLFSGVGLGIALTPVPNTAISPTALKPYVLETPLPIADFYIGQYSNGSYYAINGSNWNTFVVSTNTSYVFNTVSSFATGLIHVGQGTFLFTNHTDIRSNQIWEGEGTATHLKLADNLPNSNNAYWENFCFFLSPDGSYIENVTIRNMGVER